MSKKVFRYTVYGILLLLVLFVLKTVYQAGQLKILEPHFKGTVTIIDGIKGAEDITIHQPTQMAFIGADDRFLSMKGKGGFGGIYSLDLKQENPKPKLLTEGLGLKIHPHGISLVEGKFGELYLYVVDHSAGGHSILLFSYYEGHLSYKKRFDNPEFMISPNDVMGIDENSFYFTNDHGTADKTEKMIHDYLQLSRSSVIYFDGEKYQTVLEDVGYANGINRSKDASKVYVAATIDRTVWVYDRDEMTGALTLADEVYLNTGVDNIEVDQEGNLWVGCHPKLLTFTRHAKKLSIPSPSQVIKVELSSSGNHKIKEVYLNEGEELSASSVAAVSGNKLLIGPVFDDHILLCNME